MELWRTDQTAAHEVLADLLGLLGEHTVIRQIYGREQPHRNQRQRSPAELPSKTWLTIRIPSNVQ
jgi:hypothetical protein